MKINDVIHGFKIINIRDVDEIDAQMYEMVHEKTAAKTIWLKRDDENKSFSIGFKTTPEDDTGVFHILEHSVLNGSKRYPVKEPFVDLLKGSLQTFLNAMTFPDKTLYPVSSRNNKDFVNLMRVYLDAVFHPLAMENSNVFYQEGWHYELLNKDEDPIYKGVVFNEMKGAFSSADSVRYRVMMHSLFPDNCYGNESGGDPDYITDLTYEQFCASHKKYYNPSNSYIFLDGDMDVENVLGIIDDEYLSHYDNSGEKIVINKQKPHIAEDVIKEFEISSEESPENKAQIAYGYVVGDFDDYEKNMAFSLLSSVLCSSNESPLKKVILNNKLGEDIIFDIQSDVLQPYVEIDVINTDLDKADLVEKTIHEELERIIKEGVDKEELEATLNQREFKVKESDFGSAPKGLIYGITLMSSWLYDGDPVDSLCFSELFDSLRKKINTSYYEDLIRDYILNSNHKAKVYLKPSNTLGKEKAEKEKARLDKIASTWSDKDKDELVNLNKELQVYQNSTDTPEQKATLPYLHLEDLKKTPTHYSVDVEKYGDNVVLSHDNNTNGISYVSLDIKVDDFELEEYSYMQQMLSLLGKLPTEKYDVLKLNQKMKGILGDFSVSFSPTRSYKNQEGKIMVFVRYSALNRNDQEALDLIKEIIYKTKFDDKQTIRDVLKQNLFALQQTFSSAGHVIALQRAGAYTSPISVVSEYAGGLEGYRFMKDIDDNYDAKAGSFINKLKELYQKIFIKERYSVSVTSENKELILKSLLDDAPSGVVNKPTIKKPLGNRKEGIIVPANVSFASKTCNLSDDIKNLGAMYVISNILTYDYLWNNIRVKNGAYGCGFRCGLAKVGNFYSYRDPNPGFSLDTFTDTVNYLKEFVKNTDSIENYIVGTTGDFDPLLSTKLSIRMADSDYYAEVSYQDRQEILDQILNTNKEDLLEAIKLFEKMNEEDNICVVGNKDALEKCKDKFKEIFDFNTK